ncbi:MAG: hypothetical protein ACXWZL_06650 [Mycobacterium sp.]
MCASEDVEQTNEHEYGDEFPAPLTTPALHHLRLGHLTARWGLSPVLVGHLRAIALWTVQLPERLDMTDVTEKHTEPSVPAELLDEVRESAKMGQNAAVEALRKFRHTVNEAVPEALEPLRTQLVDAAIELADKLVTAQYQFNRNLVRTADRALSKSDEERK